MNNVNRLDFEIIEVKGSEALSKLFELRDEMSVSRRYPFIIGESGSLEMLAEICETSQNSTEEIIEKSLAIDVKNLFDQLKKNSLPGEEETEFDLAELAGDWEENSSPGGIGLFFDDFISAHADVLSKIPFERCYIGLALTAESWQLPAFARYGDWNACPAPEKHCGVLRYWQEKYAAEIISLTGDVIECRVADPPQTEAECFALAWEQYAYCPDIVDQGAETIGALASALRDADYWYFWWD